MSKVLPLSSLVAVLAVAACTDAPIAAPDVVAQFLIGSSPLSPIWLDTTPGSPELFVPLTVNRGIAQAAAEDKFVVRLTVTFKVDPCDACTVGPSDNSIVGQKDTEVRQGSDVAIVTCVNLPPDTWDAIKDLTDVPVQAVAELVMVTGSGAEKVVDSVTLSGAVDPKDTGA